MARWLLFAAVLLVIPALALCAYPWPDNVTQHKGYIEVQVLMPLAACRLKILMRIYYVVRHSLHYKCVYSQLVSFTNNFLPFVGNGFLLRVKSCLQVELIVAHQTNLCFIFSTPGQQDARSEPVLLVL